MAPLKRIHNSLYGLHQLSPRRGFPIHKEEKFKPFFIIGSGRSGNTLLRRILYSHRDLYIPPETYVLGSTIHFFQRNRHFSWDQSVKSVLSQFEFHREFETFNLSLRPLANQLYEAPRELRSLAFILNSFYRYCGANAEKDFKRWGDKTPLNTFSLSEILSVFPDAQFIHLIRNGYDASYSYVKSGIYQDADNAAQRWEKSVRLASQFAHKHSQQCIELKYEDLVSKTEASIKKICTFLAIDFQPKMLSLSQSVHELGDVTMRDHHSEVLKPISTASVGKGLKGFNSNDKEIVQGIIQKEMKRLGYSDA